MLLLFVVVNVVNVVVVVVVNVVVNVFVNVLTLLVKTYGRWVLVLKLCHVAKNVLLGDDTQQTTASKRDNYVLHYYSMLCNKSWGEPGDKVHVQSRVTLALLVKDSHYNKT